MADEPRQLGASVGMVGMLTSAVAAAERYGFGRADALVVQRLGWTHAVPLQGAEVIAGLGAGHPRRSGTAIAASMEYEGARVKSLLIA